MTTFGDNPACPRCGSAYSREHRFCGVCGAELPAPDLTADASDEISRLAGAPYVPEERPGTLQRGPGRVDPSLAAPVADSFPYYIAPGRVVALTLLSSGLYIFFWMYVTWRQYRDHTGEVAYPVMHALALLVPVYQFFRLHAHIRVYQELMETRGVPTTLNPLRAVLVYFGVVLLGMVSIMMPTEAPITLARQAAYVAVTLGQATLLAWIMWQAQTNINRLWQHRLGMRLSWMRLNLAELALVAVGFLLGWGMLLIILIDPSLLTTTGFVEPSTPAG